MISSNGIVRMFPRKCFKLLNGEVFIPSRVTNHVSPDRVGGLFGCRTLLTDNGKEYVDVDLSLALREPTSN